VEHIVGVQAKRKNTSAADNRTPVIQTVATHLNP
jgi:hypothetical protein